ncbi:MAG TPA: hypothetical protein VFP50_16550, partial [Anaeromyxobacteraceae bacterium]|nr:hypothetical protein [Anaeromyxobacteraceae bacterium]
LLGGEAAAEAAWYARATRGELRPTSWDAAGAEVVLPAIAIDLEGTRLAGDGPPLEALPGLVRDAEELWRRSARGVNLLSPATQARQGRRLVAAWLTGALARRGFALEVRPGATRVLRRGGEAVEPGPLVEALAAGALSEADCLEACRRWEGPAAA